MIETRTAHVSLEDNGDGPIVAARIQPNVVQSLNDAQANIEACIRAAGNQRCRLMVDIRKAELLSAEVRHYYTGEQLTQWFSALAVLVEASPLGRVMGNLYLRIVRPRLLTKLFEDEDAAITWLRRGKP
jgi:hypothetical protein